MKLLINSKRVTVRAMKGRERWCHPCLLATHSSYTLFTKVLGQVPVAITGDT